MKESRFFNPQELQRVEKAVLMAEELVNNFFKLSSGQWLKNRYDIKTAKDLAAHERVEGPFAQVVKYEGRKKGAPLSSSSYSLYTICIQDQAILFLEEKNKEILLDAFLLYILVHELVHVVRFSRFKHRYENASEASVTLEEERKVHGLTYAILEPVKLPGLAQVLGFYEKWRKRI
ncbi:hypothetical protein [Desulfospira joergensenii]|uniref:hypothetical protein n=1 Tax=Desulfospira joergensenii TaxID=53329 RepID=UPI000409EBCC|nr:hypothetical protein [Desulfospira joergensenii]